MKIKYTAIISSICTLAFLGAVQAADFEVNQLTNELYAASVTGDVACIQRILKDNPNLSPASLCPALQGACSANQVDAVNAFLSHSIYNECGINGEVFHWAFENGHTDIAKLLVDTNGVDADVLNASLRSAIDFCEEEMRSDPTSRPSMERIKVLIKSSRVKVSLLHESLTLALNCRDEGIISSLLNDKRITADDIRYVFNIASSMEDFAVIDIISNSQPACKQQIRPLVWAAENLNNTVLTYIATTVVDLDDESVTLAMKAVVKKADSDAVIRTLLTRHRAKVGINEVGDCLKRAVSRNDNDIVKLILADQRVEEEQIAPALELAISIGHELSIIALSTKLEQIFNWKKQLLPGTY